MLHQDTVLLVYAKAPIEGKVNTRLIADIGVKKATQLQADLVEARLADLARANLCQTILMCAPNQRHPFFVDCAQKHPILLENQVGANLGERMLHGIKKALKNYRYCVLIGSDAPVLNNQKIQEAIEALKNQSKMVIVPAEDGGYVLIAMDKVDDFLFENISWGSDLVFTQTKSQLESNNIPYTILASSWDIDRLSDYQRYLKLKVNSKMNK